jgi:alkanesulfonate monooxygenase SsuD/methylene tetrahydromethanopterin reductase-like flavin-dependent oxidoreductase (luciferase family)
VGPTPPPSVRRLLTRRGTRGRDSTHYPDRDTFSRVEGIETFSERIEPHSPGLRKRTWYGGAGLRSAQWAGANGLNFLTSNVIRAESSDGEPAPDFAEIQRSHIEAFRAAHPDGPKARASQGLVVIPTDRASATQKAKYQAYVDARTPPHRDDARPGPNDVRPGCGR